ncbi:MAG: aspartate aminotransferase [Granulosicoccus sp.]
MFENTEHTPLYGANLVASQFKADLRSEKIDLGLGVYKNDDGITPVMAAVKSAESWLLENQQSKSYLGLMGDQVYSSLMLDLVLGEETNKDCTSVIQTPGGVSALSLCCHLLKTVNPDTTVWVSDPSWANHVPIITHAGLKSATFPYYDPATAKVDFEAMRSCLESLPCGDVILLQVSCHNPTGADLTPAQWQQVANICLDRELLPLLDVAYQGFAENLDADAYGVRHVFSLLPELMIASTCSKTFSVYRDRAGIAAVMSKNPDNAARTLSLMRKIANVTYAMPADHAAAVVRHILSDSEMQSLWTDELSGMCERVKNLRSALAAALKRATNSTEFDFLTEHRGMFSLLPLSNKAIDRLREKHAIYLVQGGRVNVAGLQTSQIDRVAAAIAEVQQLSHTQ